jgi:hypothetical protein
LLRLYIFFFYTHIGTGHIIEPTLSESEKYRVTHENASIRRFGVHVVLKDIWIKREVAFDFFVCKLTIVS